MNLASPMEKR